MTDRSSTSRSSNRLTPWHLLLLVPYVAVLWVPFYNSAEPRLAGIPFFYLYQLAWVVISSILTAIVYMATRRR
jgi:hypothetical protein